MLFEGLSKKPPSLVDLCVRTAIDNVKYIGYVGGVDFQLLEHSATLYTRTADAHRGFYSYLSPITNKFWKRFYQKQYGEKNLNNVMERMKREKVDFCWRQLYEAKLKVLQEAENEASDRLKLVTFNKKKFSNLTLFRKYLDQYKSTSSTKT